LTGIYAVYAFGALAALLVAGRLSDHVGRRRMVIVALAVQIAGMAAFIGADGIAMLYLARILQGIGTGIATGALSAWLLDLQPPGDPRFAGLVGGVALIAGLGTGALGSSLLVQYAPDPLHLVYWLLGVVFAVALLLMPLLPDMVSRAPGGLRSLIPRVGVPRAARSSFLASAPSLVAVWALGGLYLSLGPSLAVAMLKTPNSFAGGSVIAALLVTGAFTSVAARRVVDRGRVIVGSLLVLILGVVITLVGVSQDSIAALYGGSVTAGLGFGPAFSGVVRSVSALAPPAERGSLLASMYIVIYLSFSVPAIVAGLAVTRFSLVDTTYAYGLGVIALAGITVVAIWRRGVASTVTH
jgi:MFS family permease